jgi:hypothetical protein
MKLQEPLNPRWICVDPHFCTEFGETVDDCIERYQESMGEINVKELTFYELVNPYIAEPVYILKRKPK